MSYSDDLANISDISFDRILKIAKANVPNSRRDNPWIGLNHGVKILTNDDEMAQYLDAYGAIHREKLNTAFDTIENPQDYVSRDIVIIDWGCGQGLATMCFYDYMHNFGIEPSVKKVILIEPSTAALNRANEHVEKYTRTASISLVNKYINDVELTDISIPEDCIILHFFSNILDITTVDLDLLSNLIQYNSRHEQILFCVGPQNAGASRIAEFAKLFNLEDDDLLAERSGLLRVRGTISMMVFRIKANIPEIIKIEYYRPRRTDVGNNTALNRIISDMSESTSLHAKALQFYRSVVALERMKSSDIKADGIFYYPYTLEKSDSVKFNIDIQDNQEFEQVFKHNFNRAHTKWPKNLNIGLSIFWNNTIYRLFDYIYPHEDLKAIDISKQFISVNLSMFSVCSDVASKLELTDDVIEVITSTLLDSHSSLDDLESIIKDAISHTVTLYPQLSLTLTAEAPVLAQITSELKTLSERDVSPLLMSFLSGCIENNTADTVSEDEIINIVDMDDSQRLAITKALNSKVSVVTGPPGTGKTQMIVNLLANAMLKDKSVLVASKNNKAVDNIKERFDQVGDFQYLLRFGSRDMISSKLIPTLNSFITRIPNVGYDATALSKLISNYNLRCNSASDSRKQLGELVRLTDSICEIETEIKKIEQIKTIIETDYLKAIEKLNTKNADISELTCNDYDWGSLIQKELSIQKTINTLEVQNKGLRKLFFNLFKRDKFSVQVLNDILSLPLNLKDKIEKESNVHQVSDIKNCTDLIAVCKNEQKYLKRINTYRNELSALKSKHSTEIADNKEKLKNANQNLSDVKRRIQILSAAQDKFIRNIQNSKEYISSISDELLTGFIKCRLANDRARHSIARYQNYLLNNIPWKDQDLTVFIQDARNFIDTFRLSCVTSLSVKSAYPLNSELFDIVIIDEASQCDIASALPLIYRAKQVVVIGDPMQLKHITSVSSSEERAIKESLGINENPFIKYVDYSLWDYCKDLITSANNNNTHVTLDCHYRCHPHIIGYSNELFYQRRLGTTLKVCTKDSNNQLRYRGIIWEDVRGKQWNDTRNVNEAEARKAISLALDVAKQCPSVSIGIISPFKHQAEEINLMIPAEYRDRIVSDTVHKFQGDERDVIIYSTVVTDNSPDTKIQWIDKNVPNLVNVAVTRARTTLYVVGNREYIRTHSSANLPLGYLVEYTERVADTPNRKETIIIDTNVFVNCPYILDRIDPTMQVVISAKVIDELDKLKITLDDAKRKNVELALRNINRIFNVRSIRMECADLEYLPIDFSRRNPDNMILSVALKYKNQNPTLLTSDNGLQLKAKGLSIRTKSLQAMLEN